MAQDQSQSRLQVAVEGAVGVIVETAIPELRWEMY